MKLNWISGNKLIDNLVQEMQSKINKPSDIIFELISYNQFYDIKEMGKDDLDTVYTAIWKDGLLYYNFDDMKIKQKGRLKAVAQFITRYN